MQKVINHQVFIVAIVCFLTILACDGGFETSSPGPTVTIPSTIEGLAAALADPNYAIRSRAAKALGEMGPEAAPAVPDLAQALSDSRFEMRLFAAEALSEIGPAAAPALPEIIAALRSEKLDQEGPYLIITLGNIGATAEPAVQLLVEILEYGKNDFTRSLAAESLGKIGDPKALPALVKVLETEGGIIFDVREEAVVAIANFGEQARFTVPVLVELLYDKNQHIAALSACAIAKITGEVFPDSSGNCKGAYQLSENGEAHSTIAAREWWKKEGRYQEWDTP